jgi:nucleotide-binding universal stress UspA family protein
MVSAADKILKQAQKRAVHIGVATPKLRCGWGDAAESIIDAIRSEKTDILVVGRRGRGRLTGLLLGSVSQKLATLAPCIVMVVP